MVNKYLSDRYLDNFNYMIFITYTEFIIFVIFSILKRKSEYV